MEGGRAGSRWPLARGWVLDHRGQALAHADAHRGQPVAAAAAAQLVGERAEQPGARAAERVAERDRAAVDVQLVVVEARARASRRAPATRTPRSARPGRCPSTRGRRARAPCAWRARGRSPCSAGSTPADALPRSAPAARGPARVARSSLATTRHAAPSLSDDELPAVTRAALAEDRPAAWRGAPARCRGAGPRRRGSSPGRPSAGARRP